METKNKIVKRIAIVGPESTGKSTLSEQLANYYHTLWVPEFARNYIAGLDRKYTLEDIVQISKGQIKSEDELALKANALLICDTNLLVTKIWAEHAFQQCPEWITENLRNRKYDLNLLTDIDIPWEADPQREHPHLRKYFFDLYKKELESSGVNFVVISGGWEERLANSIKAINRLV